MRRAPGLGAFRLLESSHVIRRPSVPPASLLRNWRSAEHQKGLRAARARSMNVVPQASRCPDILSGSCPKAPAL